MNISHYGFVCQVNFSNEKYIRVRKKKFLEIFLGKSRYQVFVIIRENFPSDKYYSYSYLQVLEFMNYSYSYLYRSWLSESIPIPIRRENYYSLITELHLHFSMRDLPSSLLICKRLPTLDSVLCKSLPILCTVLCNRILYLH